MKRALAGGLFAAATLLGGLALTSGGVTSAETTLCPDNVDGYGPKIDYNGGQNTIEVSAPDGKLIAGYCVKAGSDTEQSGGGVVFVTVDPPAKTVIIDHPTKDSISHYSLKLVNAPPPTTAPPTTAPPTTPQPTTPQPTPAPPQTPAPAPTVAAQGPLPAAPTVPAAAAPPAAAPTALPTTGDSSWVLALMALAALAGGTTLVRMSRRPTD